MNFDVSDLFLVVWCVWFGVQLPKNQNKQFEIKKNRKQKRTKKILVVEVEEKTTHENMTHYLYKKVFD